MRSLFDERPDQRRKAGSPRPAQAARDQAVACCEQGADQDFLLRADTAVQRVAGRQAFLTSDDVWAELREQPREPRVMGPIMMRAAKAGIITATNQWRQSESATNHGRPQRVWRSNLYRGTDA
jgi:hypothetical protein